MTHVPHDLVEEFPEHRERLHVLKAHNPAFAKLSDTYFEVNHEIYKIESGMHPTTDEVLETLKKQRLHVLDQIHDLLQHAA